MKAGSLDHVIGRYTDYGLDDPMSQRAKISAQTRDCGQESALF
jgi:hypothetical protein